MNICELLLLHAYQIPRVTQWLNTNLNLCFSHSSALCLITTPHGSIQHCMSTKRNVYFMQKNETEPILYLTQEINLIWIKDLNVKN